MHRRLAILLLLASCRQILGIEDGVVAEPPSDTDPGDTLMGEAGACPQQCTSCNFVDATCRIDCQFANCTSQVVCPPGWACDILCTTPNSCRNGIDCTKSTVCLVECSGSSSCRNLSCGAGPCLSQCTGNNSCSGVVCGTSCACEVMCDADASCSNVTCTSVACENGKGCSALTAGCNTCQ